MTLGSVTSRETNLLLYLNKHDWWTARFRKFSLQFSPVEDQVYYCANSVCDSVPACDFMLENVYCFSVKHYTNYLMNNLLPFSQAAIHASSPKKLSVVAHGAAAPTTHFRRVPFGLLMNCPYSLCFLEGLPKKHSDYLGQLLSGDDKHLWKTVKVF